MTHRDGYRVNQRVRITAGAHHGCEGLVRGRYMEPHGDGVEYEVRLSGGETVFLPEDIVEAVRPTETGARFPSGV